MRPRSQLLSVFACLALAGCTASSGLEGIELPRPSLEMTNSVVVPDKPLPPATVWRAGRGLDTPANRSFQRCRKSRSYSPRSQSRACASRLATAGSKPPFPRCQADQFRNAFAKALAGSRRRCLALAGRHRLGETAHAGRELRLHQSDRRRRPSRPDVQEQLARRQGSRDATRRLPFLLLVPHRRRTGRLVHPQRAQGGQRLSAGDRCRMERRIRCRKRRLREKACWKRCRSSWTGWSSTMASARSSIPRRISTRTIFAARFPTIISGCARWRRIHERCIPAANGCSGNIRVRACQRACSGRIDLNVFNGSESDWNDWLSRHAG